MWKQWNISWGRCSSPSPSPALREDNVTIRTLVEVDGERKVYEGPAVCLFTEELPTPEPLFGTGIDAGDGMVGYVGYLEQRGKENEFI